MNSLIMFLKINKSQYIYNTPTDIRKNNTKFNLGDEYLIKLKKKKTWDKVQGGGFDAIPSFIQNFWWWWRTSAKNVQTTISG